MGSSSEYSEASSEHSTSSPESNALDGGRDALGRLVSTHLDAPVIDDLDLLTSDYKKQLEALAFEPRNGRLKFERMEEIILLLCSKQYLTISVLAQLVSRNPDGMRQQYMSKMVKSGDLVLAFPTKPTHEKQAYRAANNH